MPETGHSQLTYGRPSAGSDELFQLLDKHIKALRAKRPRQHFSRACRRRPRG